MTHTWPTRTEWQAFAESYIRTLVMPYERVPQRADHWLDPAELAELRAAAHQLAATLRPRATRTVNTLNPLFRDEPGRSTDRITWSFALTEEREADYEMLCEARYDRLHLGRHAREFDDPDLTVTGARMAGRSFTLCAGRWSTDDTAASLERVAQLLDAMRERCDTAAGEATEAAVRDEIARRGTDEAWIKELKRRERIDQSRTSPVFH